MGETVIAAAKTPATNRENRASPKKTEVSQVTDSPAEQILLLQRTIGNRAVERLIRSGALQAKLRIGQHGDKYEQEADRVAEQVMRMPDIARSSYVTVRPIEHLMLQLEQNPTVTPACHSIGVLGAPDARTLSQRLANFGILQSTGRSTDFSNILYRHVTAGSRIGNAYINSLRSGAYPMNDFCISYSGGGWNATFRDVLHYYGYSTPTHRDMRLVAGAVLDHDRTNLFIYDENEMFPGGQRDPFASPLTPRTLARKTRGTVLAGSPIEGVLLLRATDAYLSTLTIPAAAVSRVTPTPVTGGASTASDVFQWGTEATEGTVGDPNRFDAIIVHWTRHYNEIFQPLDARGSPNPLDPDLIKAMIYCESRFSETASSRGSSARGLTQVLAGERQAAGETPAGVSGVTETTFTDPGVQIAVGIRILFEKYRRSRDWGTAIRDYNGSPRRDAYRDEVLRVYRAHQRSPQAR